MTTIRVRDLKAGDRIKLWFEGEKYYDTSTSNCVVATVVDADVCSRMTTVRYVGDNGEEGTTRIYTVGVVEAAETEKPEKPKAAVKYNKSEIMKKAHMLRKDYGLNKSAALKQAWVLAKDAARKAELGMSATFVSKGELYKAFYKVNPNGYISGIFGAYKVRFTPNGKTYNYSLDGVIRLLGFAA